MTKGHIVGVEGWVARWKGEGGGVGSGGDCGWVVRECLVEEIEVVIRWVFVCWWLDS